MGPAIGPTVSGVWGREHVALLTAPEAAALDRRAQQGGIPERALMENAGRAAAQVIGRLHPRGRIVAAVGSGNNGGDALVALRSLHEWGRDVAWLPAGSSDPDLSLLNGLDLPRLDRSRADTAFAGAECIVDGILGTGASGEPREPAAEVIRAINDSGRAVVALDIPSGVDPSTGRVPGLAVQATATIQFGWPKAGALFQPGRAHCGRLISVEIGFPPLEPEEAGAALITSEWARARLPARSQDAHKNSVGRVLVVAGQKGMAGAAAIAGHSAMRAGAGYVRIATVEANRAVVQALVPEALFVDRSDPEALREAVGQCDAVLIGPGLGTDPEGVAILDLVLGELTEEQGCVLDADALTILAERLDIGDGRGGGGASGGGGGGGGGRSGRSPRGILPAARVLLTPHPGEMSRLTGLSTAEVQEDPTGHARNLADRLGVGVLLKGAPSVVARSGDRVLVSTVGSSDLATAAMGDQLGAEAATFMAAGGEAAEAGALGLFYGGRAAELAGRGRSLTPHDIADNLHAAFRDPGPDASPLGLPFVLFDQPARW